MTIKVKYSSIDGAGIDRIFGSLEDAQKWSHRWVGAHPSIGSTYAVSDDGIGKIEVEGCTLAELFPEPGQTTEPVHYRCLNCGVELPAEEAEGTCPQCGTMDQFHRVER